jgi:hypothetical protein
MADLKFGSPEWRAKFLKKGSRPSATHTTGDVKTVRLRNGKVLQFASRGKKLKTWQLVLGGAVGALLLQHLIAPKGTSIVSKVFTGWGHGEMPSPFGRGGAPWGLGYGGGGGHGGWPYGRDPQYYVGAVNRGGFKGGAGMPFGPGPWPTQNATPPANEGVAPQRPSMPLSGPFQGAQPADFASMPPGPAMDMTNEPPADVTGWGVMTMPTPFGRGGPPFGLGYGGGGGNGGWPYGGYDGAYPWWG